MLPSRPVEMSTELLGVLAMIVSSLSVNVLLTLCSLVAAKGWSDSAMLAVACTLGLVLLLMWLLVSRPPSPTATDARWISCIGFFSAGSCVLMFLAVHVGIPLGDFAAMNSTNTVFAAFLGRLFLGEAMRWSHYAAVVMSLAGAILISQPEAIFGPTPGQEAQEHAGWIGYVLALLSGFCDGCMYVCSRKADHVRPIFIHVSIMAQLSLAITASSFAMDYFDLGPFAAAPAEALGWLAGIFVVGGVGFGLFVTAAQACPAAVSATVDTATRMTSGFGAQLLLSGAAMTPETLSGAALMLLGVAFMALARAAPEGVPALEGAQGGEVSEGPPASADQPSDGDTDSLVSLVSFAASEFSGCSARAAALRQRHSRRASTELSPQVLGVVLAGLPGPPCITTASA
ncbi:unnamed protein product [Prorocentrum cordatum]|uniref:EamA domain-containing protein n=1 Tax=Prorocentrum cordatum TaxID=2364126 RepID=A0ABN9VS13_9DINO|nr:unnamed protein product [Polarella glacialis]|mmetsp:Transcript_65921/g.171545  ORF Transcript_65921/g.171545 Transcript_65921/m.171545 type:complete len:401 (-) Transcript_65921:344-1546(-)